MAARTPLPDLPKGHEFPRTRFRLTSDDVAKYLEAVGDSNAVYVESGLAPPLAVAARALGSLLDTIELPGGTLHSGQEMNARAGVEIGSELELSGRIAQRSERAGMIISVIEFDVMVAGAAEPALTGRTTVIVTANGEAATAT